MTNGHTMLMPRAALREQMLLRQQLLRGRDMGQPDGCPAAAASDDREFDEYLSEIVLGDPGSCCDTATTTVIVTDNSGSVGGSGGNDPTSRRHHEAGLAIRHVAAACRCGRERVALLPFDQPSMGLVLPQHLHRSGIRRLERGMRIAEGTGASSSLLPALIIAERLAKLTPNHAAVVVLSDFELCDDHPDRVLERLASFPGYSHAVVLGGFTPGWLKDERVATSEILPESKPGEVAQAIFDGLTCYRQGVAPG